jgi:uncharacterized membrane protein YdjX (TVP38/TMEM64 family)
VASTGPSRTRLLLIAALLVAIVAAIRWLPVQRVVDWVATLGAWGPVVLGGLYALACVLAVPASLMTLAAGALFGLPAGLVTVSLASTLGATLAFLVGRHLARDLVAAKVARNASFAALDGAVARQGFRIVLLTRLSPLFPFNLLNFGYGLTRVSLRDFVLASWLGMLPGTVLYVALGAAFGEAAGDAQRETSAAEWWLRGLGLAATIAVTLMIARLAKRALAEAAPAAPASSPAAPQIP